MSMFVVLLLVGIVFQGATGKKLSDAGVHPAPLFVVIVGAVAWDGLRLIAMFRGRP